MRPDCFLILVLMASTLMLSCSQRDSGGANPRANGVAAGVTDASVPAADTAGGSAMRASGAGTPASGDRDAGRSTSNEAGRGALPDASTGSAQADSGLPSDQGDVQHCMFKSSCFEFRMHRPSCFTSNATNCANIGSGVYGIGPCNGTYSRMHEDQTSCGLTVTFAN
jgi:hypothetical protein